MSPDPVAGAPAERPEPTKPPTADGPWWAPNFLADFIIRFYADQHVIVRSIVFVFFVLLMGFLILRASAGEYAVYGRIMQRTGPRSSTPVEGHEVGVNGRLFGTNSRGEYALVLGSARYAMLKLGQKPLAVEVIRAGRQVVESDTLRLQDGDYLQDIYLATDAPTPTGTEPFGRLATPPPGMLDWLVPPALAQASLGGDRLVFRGINLIRRPEAPRNLTPRLNLGGVMLDLVSGSTGQPAGSLPVVPGGIVSFGDRYLFAMSPLRAWTGEIEFQLGGGGFLQKTPMEALPVSSELPYGKPQVLHGHAGLEVEVRRLSPYDVVLYSKQDLGATDPLREDLTRAGLLVVDRPSPLGAQAQTNSLFGGRGVPFTVVQQIARIASARGVRLKQIRYGMALRSGRVREVQLGGDRSLEGAAAIPAARLERILTATSEEEFKAALRSAGPLSGFGIALTR